MIGDKNLLGRGDALIEKGDYGVTSETRAKAYA
jgi:hypothetical protein